MPPHIIDVLRERGFVAQITDATALRDTLTAGPMTLYAGYDPTAPSLHVGHLTTLMALAHFAAMGHNVIVVLGGGTARVGDPSGKTEMRQMLSAELIVENTQKIQKIVTNLFPTNSPNSPVIVDNAEWLLNLKYIDFLRDIGRFFSVNRMLTVEAYKQRLERGLSFLEFNYQILQAYDFLQLCQRYACVLQMGGDDQWGNIVAGVDLCRRVARKEVYGLTVPLLLTSAGQKMGKTAEGAVWLDAQLLSPYDYYQYWVNMRDDDLVRMLKLFTFLPITEIEALTKVSGEELNMAKSILAYETTALIHGTDAAIKAHAAALGAFGNRSISSEVLPSSNIPRASAGSSTYGPSTKMLAQDLRIGIDIADLLVRVALSPSKKQARRLVAQGGVTLNNKKIQDENYIVRMIDTVDNTIELRVGKKHVHRIILTT